MDYLYDGTFDGFLCCVYAHYYMEKATGICPEWVYQRNFLSTSQCVPSDVERANRVAEAIAAKISEFSLRRVFRVFLSSDPNKEMLLLRYIQLGFRVGAKVDSLHANQHVLPVQQIERKVSREVERLEGLLRFSVLETDSGAEVLYAPVKPDHDMICLMAHHFADRLGEQPFVIHDLRREKGLFCQNRKWYESPLPKDVPLRYAQGEQQYRSLWKQYFQAIAIEERKNQRCQRNFMPVRYWENLTEMRGCDNLYK